MRLGVKQKGFGSAALADWKGPTEVETDLNN
jgi:hypothetical protein